jgi:hypothetical protein
MNTITRVLTALFRHVLTLNQTQLQFTPVTISSNDPLDSTDKHTTTTTTASNKLDNRKLTKKEEMIVAKHIKSILETDLKRDQVVQKYGHILSEEEMKSTLEVMEQNQILIKLSAPSNTADGSGNKTINTNGSTADTQQSSRKRKQPHMIGLQSTLNTFMDKAPKVAKKKHCIKCRVVVKEDEVLCDPCSQGGQDIATAHVIHRLESKALTEHRELHEKCHKCKGSPGTVPIEEGYPSCKQIECSTLWDRIYNTETRNKLSSVSKHLKHIPVAYDTSYKPDITHNTIPTFTW